MILKHNSTVQIILVLLLGLFLLLFSGLRSKIDNSFNSIALKVRGEGNPDTNIVLIHISSEDISRIGPWPIKRNYYALMINQLEKLGAKKIGMEIFLSSRLVTQAVYDQLLKNEIEKSGKVILSSVAGKIIESGKNFYTDSLSYPSPKLLNENFPSGHLNFIKEEDYIIPLIIKGRGIEEKAFSLQLSGTDIESNSIIINFNSSWKKFRNYTFIEFSELIYENSAELNQIKNKIVIIGISDSQIAPTLQTTFDDQLPGMALHGFAIDNILNNRFISSNYYILSGIALLLLVAGFIYFNNLIRKRKPLIYLVYTVTITLICFSLYTIFQMKIAVSFFILPFFGLLSFELYTYFIKEKETLKGALNETDILKKLLIKKERELSQLQSELQIKGIDSAELKSKIRHLKADIEKLQENEEDKIRAEIESKTEVKNFHDIVYCTGVMEKVVELVKKAAPTDATVLISGESGTGKELVARAIHKLSKREGNNFIAINCGALSENLLESELFGHVRGAFTGATVDKKGRFETANKGTIFLDEIGETTENFQLKLLRVLQSGEIEKVGSSQTNKVDVRVVAATNKKLESLVKGKKFREDLYYRLNVFKLDLPSLRERREDIESLALHFMQHESESINLSKAVMEALKTYDWKGNVRELQSVIKRAIIFASSEDRNLIQLSDLPGEIVREIKYNFEDHVLESLRNKKFSHSAMTETAKELGNVNRTMISENFRGLVLKVLYETNFNLNETVFIISNSNDESVNERVLGKIETFVSNIEKDIKNSGSNKYETIRKKLDSKYRNLPVKFHRYLDEIIRWKINEIAK